MAAVMSMTGFGSAPVCLEAPARSGAPEPHDFVLDLRSVNHRHAEVRVRLPWAAPALEARVVAAVRTRCRRGRVDVVLRPAPARADPGPGRLGHRLPPVRAELEALVESGALPGPVTLEAVALCAALGGEVRGDDTGGVAPEAEAEAPLWAALDAALDAWTGMRRAEGERMAEAVRELMGRVEGLLEEIAQRVTGQPERIAERLQGRVEAVLASLGRELDETERSRMLGEIALLVDRADVTEELVRLRAHFAQVRAVLASEGPHGRKLEFLLQEIHREVNTTGSKAVDAEVSRRVVAIKAELEKVREIVLNIE